jgi:succinate dehydrogenase / fumarate reductase cytochrome b subunit
MADATKKKRPVYLDLVHIRLPLPGFVSILHRVSGTLLFLLVLMFGVAWFADSLESPASFAALKQTLSYPLIKLVLLAGLWAYLHHYCAGIRYLLLDLQLGIALPQARASSWLVMAVSITLTLLIGYKLLWPIWGAAS